MNLKNQFGRLVRIAKLIKEEPAAWDSSGLAVELGVSEATINRDIQVLKNYGEIKKQRGKGYLIQSFQFPLERFSLEEVVALSLGGKMLARQIGSPFSDVIHSAIEKMGEHLPDDMDDVVGKLDSHVSVRFPSTRDYSQHGNIFRTLNRAILNHFPVQLTYFTIRSQETHDRKVDPYGIVFRRGSWYLVGYCHLREEVRTFGIHRIKKLKLLTNEHFRMIQGFSLENYLHGSWQLMKEGPIRHIVIRFDPEIAPWVLEGKWHPTQQMTKLGDGSVLFEADVSGLLEIKRWVLSYGGLAEVLEPVELRELIAKEVATLNERYLKRKKPGYYYPTSK